MPEISSAADLSRARLRGGEGLDSATRQAYDVADRFADESEREKDLTDHDR